MADAAPAGHGVLDDVHGGVLLLEHLEHRQHGISLTACGPPVEDLQRICAGRGHNFVAAHETDPAHSHERQRESDDEARD